MHTRNLPILAIFCEAAMRMRWAALPGLPAVSLPTLLPALLGAAASMLLGSCDWCHGEVRFTLALCVGGGSASAALVVCWERCPETMARSAGRAAMVALVAVAPLLAATYG
jgi:hypothetical protein